METFEKWFIRQLEGEEYMKYENIIRWTERYCDWLKKNNSEPPDQIAKRWLRDEIDELRECIEGIRFPRWVGLTDEEIDHAAEQSDNYASFVAGVSFAQAKLKEKNGG